MPDSILLDIAAILERGGWIRVSDTMGSSMLLQRRGKEYTVISYPVVGPNITLHNSTDLEGTVRVMLAHARKPMGQEVRQ